MEQTRQDDALVRRLRDGDVDTFTEIVPGWSPAMLRVARTYVATDAAAQDVVQETWFAVVRGLDGFEGRSSVRTWVFHILVNRAKSHGEREIRLVPWSSSAPTRRTRPRSTRPGSAARTSASRAPGDRA